MKNVIIHFLLVFGTGFVFAGTAENIQACAMRASEFAGIRLNEFNANYQGKVLSMSTAKWPGVYCEVKFSQVFNLQINGKQLIFEQFAGKDSFDLNKVLEEKTDAAINQLKGRIALLEQRMEQASENLKKPKPNHASITKFVDQGLANAVGTRSESIVPHKGEKTSTTTGDAFPKTVVSNEETRELSVQSVLSQEVLIPRSVVGDKGKYYLIESSRSGDIVSALHKRIGPESVGFTKTETNCKSMLMREIGYSETSPSSIRVNPTKWFDLVAGSSKSDLANYLCKQ